MSIPLFSLFIFYLLSLSNNCSSVELSFELPDSDVQCFYEDILKDTQVTLEYQVITGGQYDIDVKVEAPNKQILYDQTKSQYDSHQFSAPSSGVYSVCFSNEFSTISHKLIYMEFRAGPDKPLPGVGDHATALTQLESSAEEIHSALNKIIDYQTHHRLREAQGRKRAEDLNERVLWWSLAETISVLIITIGQVLVLKNFFSDKPSASYSYRPMGKI